MVSRIWGRKLFWSHIRVFGHPDNEVAEVEYADVKVAQSNRPLEWLYLFYETIKSLCTLTPHKMFKPEIKCEFEKGRRHYLSFLGKENHDYSYSVIYGYTIPAGILALIH